MPLPFPAALWPAEEDVPRQASPLSAGPGGQPQGLAHPSCPQPVPGGIAEAGISHFSLCALARWGKENDAYLQGWKAVAQWKARI